jgi:hypothetical protein
MCLKQFYTIILAHALPQLPARSPAVELWTNGIKAACQVVNASFDNCTYGYSLGQTPIVRALVAAARLWTVHLCQLLLSDRYSHMLTQVTGISNPVLQPGATVTVQGSGFSPLRVENMLTVGGSPACNVTMVRICSGLNGERCKNAAHGPPCVYRRHLPRASRAPCCLCRGVPTH